MVTDGPDDEGNMFERHGMVCQLVNTVAVPLTFFITAV